MSDVNKLDETPDKHSKKKRLEELIKGQTDGCKDLGMKIQEEIESLEQIRISAKSFGIDIKTRLLELDDTLDNDDVDSLLGDSE